MDHYNGRDGRAVPRWADSKRRRPNLKTCLPQRQDGIMGTSGAWKQTSTSVVACVADGLQQRILRWTCHVRNHVIAPSPERLDNWPGVVLAPEKLLSAAGRLLPDHLLLGIETADEFKSLVAVDRVEIPDLHKFTTHMAPKVLLATSLEVD